MPTLTRQPLNEPPSQSPTLARGPEALPPAGQLAAFEAALVTVRTDQILRIQGYTDLARVRRPIRKAAAEAAAMAQEVTRGEVAFMRLPSRLAGPGTLEVDDAQVLNCAAFPRYMQGCGQTMVFALTAGAAFDDRIAQLIADDRPLEALLLDCAGWLSVEQITRQFNLWLKGVAADQGLRPTRRLGPGYSYRVGEQTVHWNLEEQQALFALLGKEQQAVQLLDSCAMLPKMSRSGVYGLRPLEPAPASAVTV